MKGKIILGAAMMMVMILLLSACAPLIEGGVNQEDVGEKEGAEIIDLKDPDSIRVLYTVSGFILSDAFDGDKSAVEELLFLHLDFDDDYITFHDKQCIGVTFEKETVGAAQYLRTTWQETPESLGFEGFEELEVIKTNCPLLGFQEYMRIGNQLVVPYEGAFIIFKPFLTY